MVFTDNRLGSSLLDAADELFFIGLPLVEALVALVAAIHDTCLPFADDFIDKRPFTFFAIGQEYLGWDTSVYIEPDVRFSFFFSAPIVGPFHRKDSVDKRTVYGNQIPQLLELSGQYLRCICYQNRKELAKFLKTTSIDSFKECALFYPLCRRNALPSKVILLKSLK